MERRKHTILKLKAKATAGTLDQRLKDVVCCRLDPAVAANPPMDNCFRVPVEDFHIDRQLAPHVRRDGEVSDVLALAEHDRISSRGQEQMVDEALAARSPKVNLLGAICRQGAGKF